ncbi:hypothetical protein PSQ40_00235 [Curvibacter sp. HBC61]|uniref:ABC transporter permease n=1 Tax=Curvibacter cyanobacteriorum TaxID=3026422 RepID=A0ABT5MT14_9BURK|nr:hypothetical protein [Curvibacter sp. HBC61]MDD0836987.1 hypothetical protein [Curvibacter sp. HBC61]
MPHPDLAPAPPRPSASATPVGAGLRQWGLRAGLTLVAVLLLLAVFALYAQPDFLLTLSNQIWACF